MAYGATAMETVAKAYDQLMDAAFPSAPYA
jgi:hypothetical protein